MLIMRYMPKGSQNNHVATMAQDPIPTALNLIARERGINSIQINIWQLPLRLAMPTTALGIADTSVYIHPLHLMR